MDKQGTYEKNRMPHKLATIISRAFGPLSTVPLILIYLYVFHTGLNSDVHFGVGISLLLGTYIIPLLLAIFFLYTKKISDVDITDRKERILLLVLISFLKLLTLLFVFIMPVTILFKKVLLFSVLTFMVTTLLTFLDKVSLHMAGVTTLTIILIQVLGLHYVAFLLLIPVVAWARFYLEKHNMRQVLIGTLIPLLLFLTEYLVMLE